MRFSFEGLKITKTSPFLRWLVRKFEKPLSFIHQPHAKGNFWHLGFIHQGTEKKPCLQLFFRFSVTNGSAANVHLSHAIIKGHEHSEIEQLLQIKKQDGQSREEWGDYPIQPWETMDGSLMFVSKEISNVKTGKPLFIDVTMVDHLGKTYQLKKIVLHATIEAEDKPIKKILKFLRSVVEA